MVVATVMAAAVVVIKCASAATTATTTADVTTVDTGMIMMIRITRTGEKGRDGVPHHRPLTTAVQGTWLAHLPEMRTTVGAL